MYRRKDKKKMSSASMRISHVAGKITPRVREYLSSSLEFYPFSLFIVRRLIEVIDGKVSAKIRNEMTFTELFELDAPFLMAGDHSDKVPKSIVVSRRIFLFEGLVFKVVRVETCVFRNGLFQKGVTGLLTVCERNDSFTFFHRFNLQTLANLEDIIDFKPLEYSQHLLDSFDQMICSNRQLYRCLSEQFSSLQNDFNKPNDKTSNPNTSSPRRISPNPSNGFPNFNLKPVVTIRKLNPSQNSHVRKVRFVSQNIDYVTEIPELQPRMK